MKKVSLFISLILILASCANKALVSGEQDPYIWLENIEGKKALGWVNGQNKQTMSQFSKSRQFRRLNKQALGLLEDKDKIPAPKIMGKYIYNFWQDEQSVRGVWRRTTLKNYRNSFPPWEVVLNVDRLALKERENWVFKGAECLPPEYRFCLVSLSRGGKDATVVREFDTKSKKFVRNGFKLKEAKTWVSWYDSNSIFVATNFGPGSLTDSGYPKTVKLWSRGSDISRAREVLTGDDDDMVIYGHTIFTKYGKVSLISERYDFYNEINYVYSEGNLRKVPKPDSAEIVGFFKKHFILQLRKPWNVDGINFAQGSIVSMKMKTIFSGNVTQKDLTTLFRPNKKSSVLSVAQLKDNLIINVLENVKGKMYAVSLVGGEFSKAWPLRLPKGGHKTIANTNAYTNYFFFSYEDFLTPDTLYVYSFKNEKYSRMKFLPAKFNAKGMVVKQNWATSQDGTKVPYFVVGKKSVLNKGKAPTLLYGYGGFEISRTPYYSPTTGKLWLEQGGVYVVANIRGGGEFGPRWHQAALKKNRQKAFDDFIAVAEDLTIKNITTKEKLGILGGSNGGLLVGTVMTQRPDLFKGVVCLVPLLDMMRYSQLLAGASWMAEYGDPTDSDMQKILLAYSPYHNVKKEKKYPSVFFMTSTKDDRVHPGHARKMAAKMKKQGHRPVFYYENTEGGHAASANLKQKAKMIALRYAYLYKTIW